MMHFNTNALRHFGLPYLYITFLKSKLLYNSSYLKLSSLPIFETTLIFIVYVIMDSYLENLSSMFVNGSYSD